MTTENQPQNPLPGNSSALWDQAFPLVERVWAGVFDATNNLVKVHEVFGFAEFEKKLNPSLSTVLLALNVLEAVLDAMYGSGKLNHDETRLVLNAKQQILIVQEVANALSINDQASYEDAMKRLAAQAAF